VEDVSKTEITESSAIIRWKKDNKQNPVDSISIMPMMDTTLPGVSRYLTIEEMMHLIFSLSTKITEFLMTR
jgi:hypothetical protein